MSFFIVTLLLSFLLFLFLCDSSLQNWFFLSFFFVNFVTHSYKIVSFFPSFCSIWNTLTKLLLSFPTSVPFVTHPFKIPSFSSCCCNSSLQNCFFPSCLFSFVTHNYKVASFFLSFSFLPFVTDPFKIASFISFFCSFWTSNLQNRFFLSFLFFLLKLILYKSVFFILLFLKFFHVIFFIVFFQKSIPSDPVSIFSYHCQTGFSCFG